MNKICAFVVYKCSPIKLEPTTKTTGTKLSKLEQSNSVKSFINSLLKDKVEAWTEQEALGFTEVFHELVHKINDCIAPISHAYYSSIMVYQSNPSMVIHAGANIDPEKKEQLKDPAFRNCAEKQAAISAEAHDGKNNSNLKLLFLFRKAHHHEVFPAEKLIPCKDCYRAYLEDLIANDGKLVLVLEDSFSRNFLLPGLEDADAVSMIRTVQTPMGESLHYVVFNARAMRFLKIEKELGARVCSANSLT